MITRKIIAVSKTIIGTQTIIKRTAQNPMGGYGYSDFGYKPRPFPLISKLFHLMICTMFTACVLDWKVIIGYDLVDLLDPEWMKREREKERAMLKEMKEEEEKQQLEEATK